MQEQGQARGRRLRAEGEASSLFRHSLPSHSCMHALWLVAGQDRTVAAPLPASPLPPTREQDVADCAHAPGISFKAVGSLKHLRRNIGARSYNTAAMVGAAGQGAAVARRRKAQALESKLRGQRAMLLALRQGPCGCATHPCAQPLPPTCGRCRRASQTLTARNLSRAGCPPKAPPSSATESFRASDL